MCRLRFIEIVGSIFLQLIGDEQFYQKKINREIVRVCRTYSRNWIEKNYNKKETQDDFKIYIRCETGIVCGWAEFSVLNIFT